ncbi:T9SS type A sorting domain-containing protein [Pontibacter beigongshangensis]|uniref:T9SS type A sorting domain-containing protein n=1 Tax=Pontibacter beigongshangensis TaxID=2574733 RepID=UPI00164F1641|nr:T9SS type A sorting domain-containing protein [Pontibacter beigongshangensis]
MRRIISLAAFYIVLSSFSFGQGFGSLGSQWYYSAHGRDMHSEYIHLQSVADTVILGKSSHKITQTYYRDNGSVESLPPIFVYEKSDTVFMYSSERKRFLSLYIFNAAQGDVLTLDVPEPSVLTKDTTYRLVIEQVENVVVNGATLKKYKTRPLDRFTFMNDGGYFMDRIGGLDWYVPRERIIPEAEGPLRCYSDAQLSIKFLDLACDDKLLVTSVQEQPTSKVEVFPNPVHDLFSVEADQPIARVEVSDLTGKLMRTATTNAVKLDGLENGFYIATIFFESGEKTIRRIVKRSL